MRKLLTLTVLALSVAATGCAPLFVRSNVSVFHELPGMNLSYVVLPMKGQEDSLEFKAYADQVRAQLNKRGFREATADDADVVVTMNYGADDGKQVVSSYPIFGQTGVRSSYTTGTVSSYGNTGTYSGTTYNTPTYGVIGSGVASQTVFTRYLWLDMFDRPALASGRIKKVYESKVQSTGPVNQLNTVMPYMIRALFEDFPGTSGKTRTVTLMVDSQ